MLHWIYIVLAAALAMLCIAEMYRAERWRTQLALVLVVLPLILRVLHLK